MHLGFGYIWVKKQNINGNGKKMDIQNIVWGDKDTRWKSSAWGQSDGGNEGENESSGVCLCACVCVCVCVCVSVSVCVCAHRRGLSCQSSYPSRAASHSQQHDRDVKQSAWPKAFNFEMAAQWIPIQMNREQRTRICTQMIWHACTQVCTYTCTNTGICGFAHPLSITSTYPPPHTQPPGKRGNVFF